MCPHSSSADLEADDQMAHGYWQESMLMHDLLNRDMTRPAVLKEAGSIIQPIQFSKQYAEQGADRGAMSKRRKTAVVAGGMPGKGRR